MESKLDQAAKHVTTGRKIIAAQTLRIATLKAKGLDTFDAECLLRSFEGSQEIFEADWERLLRNADS